MTFHIGLTGSRSVWFALLVVLATGCSYTYPRSQYRALDMSRVAVGQTENEVRGVLGPPSDVIGSRLYEGGHVIRVLQYLEAALSWTGNADNLKKNYYLYFLDGKLVQWGRPGDWQREADQIYEVRMR